MIFGTTREKLKRKERKGQAGVQKGMVEKLMKKILLVEKLMKGILLVEKLTREMVQQWPWPVLGRVLMMVMSIYAGKHVPVMLVSLLVLLWVLLKLIPGVGPMVVALRTANARALRRLF